MWLIVGFIFGATALGVVFWTRERKIIVAWYSWLVGGLGASLLLFTIWNVSTSLSELERVAARNSLWLFGIPAVILLALAVLIPWLRNNKSRQRR